jgi:hypothetical protein
MIDVANDLHAIAVLAALALGAVVIDKPGVATFPLGMILVILYGRVRRSDPE